MFYSMKTGGFYVKGLHKEMPKDVVEVSDEKHVELLDAQAAGKVIKADEKGNPVAVDLPAPSAHDVTTAKIRSLEAEITPRRLREAVLDASDDWLKKQEAKITKLRKKLK